MSETKLLPDTLVSAEVDLRDFPFTPMFRARLFGSTFHAHASDAGWRAGVTLWLKSWDQAPAGTLPPDDVDLCRLAELGRDVKSWKKVRAEALHGWFQASDGRLHHAVVAEGVNEAWTRKIAQRDRTAKARAARLNKQSSQGAETETTDLVTTSVTELETGPVTASKGQGQGQGQGQGYKKEEGGGVARETAPDYSASDQAKTITARFLDLRTEIWPNESGFPAPTMTLETQAQGFLDAGGPIDLIIEVMERSMRQAAQQGRTAANSLKAFGQSIRNAIISHKNQPNLGVLTDGPAARGESRPSGTGRATGYDPFGRERRSGVMEGPILDLSVDRG